VAMGEVETAALDDGALLRVEDLSTEFRVPDRGVVRAVRGVSLTVGAGETLGIVGESGSGKTVTMMSALGLVGFSGGRATGRSYLEGADLLSLPPNEQRQIRGKRVGVVFQDPMTSLNPVLTIGWQITETLKQHLGMSGDDARRRAVELLEMVRLPDARGRLRSYPHELSGGMRQRVMIALALSCRPRLLVADEPTTALDVTIQAQVLELLAELSRDQRMSVVIISHDLGVIARLADRVMVMYGGTVVESGTARQLFTHPRHPYTLGLLRSHPWIDRPRARSLPVIRGVPVDVFAQPPGCPFQPRCPFATDECATLRPALRPAPATEDEGHEVACWVDLGDDAVFAEPAEAVG
jgi:oligopeptide/dipeptide ABC transporter ATP-binding protein